MRIVFLIILLFSTIFAQTTVNPDISVIGDLIIENNDNETSFNSSGVEIAIQGYVNPFARADVFLHKHNDESPIHLEEAFISIERGLPMNLGLKTGKFRPDFGKINKEHMHTYYYVLPSEPVQHILGEEMWASAGVEISLLLPLPWYGNISLGVFQNGMSQQHHGHEEAGHEHKEEEHETEIAGKSFSTRLSQFFDLYHDTHLEFGLSYYQEIGNAEINTFGTDYKLKWRPNNYRSFTIQGDYFYKSIFEGTITTAGYTWYNYQFNRVWNTGLIYDFSDDIEEESYRSIGIFAGFSPVEESSVFRLRIHRACHGSNEPHFSLVAQIIWALGPHKPHQF